MKTSKQALVHGSEHSTDARKNHVGGATGRAISFVDGRILVLNHEARSDEPAYCVIDPGRFWLPKAPFTEGPVRLASRPDLVVAAYEAVRTYAERQVPSKSTHKNVVKAFRAIAKAYEFCWLHGCYGLQDWIPEVTDLLPKLLGEGGWSLALQIPARVTELLGDAAGERAKDYVTHVRRSTDAFSVSTKLQAHIGSNIRQAELAPVREILSKALGQPVEGSGAGVPGVFRSSASEGMIDSYLRQELAWINLLSEAASDTSLRYAPYPSPLQLAQRYGRPVGRTGNVTPTQVAAILSEGIKWSEDYGDHVLGLLEDIVARIESDVRQGTPATREAALVALRESPHRQHVSELVGREIVDLRPHTKITKRNTLESALANLLAGCFVVIALLNARRKDEVQHRKMGLTVASTEVVDEGLGLHLCWFYIEKTHKIHVPMYVGRATVRAIRRLEALELLTARLAVAVGAEPPGAPASTRALFRLPNLEFGTTRQGNRRWFDFGSCDEAKSLLALALGFEAVPSRITPHMFRRAYGLLFLYRFEGPLLALSQKYGHIDPIDTITYVVDPSGGGRGPAVRQYGRLSPDQIAASFEEVQEIELEIRRASDERLEQMVRDVIDGKGVGAGAFPVLIRRLHQRLARKVEYGQLKQAEKAATVFDLLRSKGHRFRPSWHGNCCAPGDPSAKRAACNRSGGRGTKQENAGPVTCSGCHYHHLVEDHVRSIERQRDRISAQLKDPQCSGLDRERLPFVLRNTERVIELHRRRLAGGA